MLGVCLFLALLALFTFLAFGVLDVSLTIVEKQGQRHDVVIRALSETVERLEADVYHLTNTVDYLSTTDVTQKAKRDGVPVIVPCQCGGTCNDEYCDKCGKEVF